MVLPAGIARFWTRDVSAMIVIAVVSALVAGYAGLVVSFFTRVPPGPAIILAAALIYLVPPTAALQAYALFGEKLSPAQIAGMIVTAAGVAMATRPKP